MVIYYTIFTLLWLTLQITLHTTSSNLFPAKNCVELKNNCTDKVGCGMALQAYYLGCHSLIYENVATCEMSCQRALIALLSTDEGQGRWFANCTCNGDPFCENQQKKISVCKESVLDLLDGDLKVVQCSGARALCEADGNCHVAFQLYLSQCDVIQHGGTCSQECRSSVDKLYKQSRAAKLRDCTCDNEINYKECISVYKTPYERCMTKDIPYRISKSGTSLYRSSVPLFLLNLLPLFLTLRLWFRN